MSDEPTRGGAITGTPSGLFEHYCEHEGCTAWGSYGFQARKAERARYFCYEHRDDGERIIGRSYTS